MNAPFIPDHIRKIEAARARARAMVAEWQKNAGATHRPSVFENDFEAHAVEQGLTPRQTNWENF